MAVVCAAYQLLKENLVSLHSVHICYCSNTLLAFILCFHPIISLLLKRDRDNENRAHRAISAGAPYIVRDFYYFKKWFEV